MHSRVQTRLKQTATNIVLWYHILSTLHNKTLFILTVHHQPLLRSSRSTHCRLTAESNKSLFFDNQHQNKICTKKKNPKPTNQLREVLLYSKLYCSLCENLQSGHSSGASGVSVTFGVEQKFLPGRDFPLQHYTASEQMGSSSPYHLQTSATAYPNNFWHPRLVPPSLTYCCHLILQELHPITYVDINT